MSGRVSVLVFDRDGATHWTARDPAVAWDDDRGLIGIGGDGWERSHHPAPADADDTGPCCGCGRHIDRGRPYVTVARHLEITRPDGTDVLEAAPVAQYHRECEPEEGDRG